MAAKKTHSHKRFILALQSTALALAIHFFPLFPVAAQERQPITSILFDDSTLRTQAPGSDNWPITWAADGILYTTWGDGGGFGGDNSNGRVSLGIGRVLGDKDSYTGENIAGGAGSLYPAPFSGKSEGMLALGNILYLWRNGDGSGAAAFKFSELYRSNDMGKTWSFTGVVFSKDGGDFIGSDNGFFSPTFLQFGRGYDSARDGYIYIYAPEIIDPSHWDVQKPGKISLIRVPTSGIENKATYRYFAGMNTSNEPIWTDAISERQSVWQHADGTHRMAVSYNAPLARYILTTMTLDRNGKVAFYESFEPWGNWRHIMTDNNTNRWGGKTVIFTFVNKWLSTDGLEFSIVHTRNDAWATIEGRFILGSETVPPAAPSNLRLRP